MKLKVYIVLLIIGFILAALNAIYIIIQWKKYKNNNSKAKNNSKNNSNKSIRDINSNVKSSFIKSLLSTLAMKVLIIIDGCFISAILITIAVLVWI